MHEHHPMGRDDYVRPDGVREVWWKCVCGLEEKRFFEDDVCLGVKYRFQGRWADAAEWLALKIPMQTCGECAGIGCPACALNGIVELDGSPILVPAPGEAPRRILP